jgi:hypothetical protein
MSENHPLVFSSVTPLQFAQLAEKARANGIDISGNSGSASQLGVEVSWEFVPATGQLTLHCLRTPFFLKLEEVNARLRRMVESATA